MPRCAGRCQAVTARKDYLAFRLGAVAVANGSSTLRTKVRAAPLQFPVDSRR